MSGWASNTRQHAVRLLSWALSLRSRPGGKQTRSQAVLAFGSWFPVTSFGPQACKDPLVLRNSQQTSLLWNPKRGGHGQHHSPGTLSTPYDKKAMCEGKRGRTCHSVVPSSKQVHNGGVCKISLGFFFFKFIRKKCLNFFLPPPLPSR